METGYTHIYYGDGKGKTTAAFGLALRCLGKGGKVIIVQFLKHIESGEVTALKNFSNVHIFYGNVCGKFFKNMTNEEKELLLQFNNEMFEKSVQMCDNINADMIIFDEIIHTLNYSVIDRKKVFDFIQKQKGKVEVVLTGRNPDKEVLNFGDYISEIKKIRHPFDMGVFARDGIER